MGGGSQGCAPRSLATVVIGEGANCLPPAAQLSSSGTRLCAWGHVVVNSRTYWTIAQSCQAPSGWVTNVNSESMSGLLQLQVMNFFQHQRTIVSCLTAHGFPAAAVWFRSVIAMFDNCHHMSCHTCHAQDYCKPHCIPVILWFALLECSHGKVSEDRPQHVASSLHVRRQRRSRRDSKDWTGVQVMSQLSQPQTPLGMMSLLIQVPVMSQLPQCQIQLGMICLPIQVLWVSTMDMKTQVHQTVLIQWRSNLLKPASLSILMGGHFVTSGGKMFHHVSDKCCYMFSLFL